MAYALGNYLIPVGTGELIAAVVLGAVLSRHPFRVGFLLVVAPGAVLLVDAVGRSAGRAVGVAVLLVLAGGFLGCAAGAGATWVDSMRRQRQT